MKRSSRFLNWRDRFGSSTTEDQRLPATPKKQPQEYPVTVEIKGKRYTGFYTVSSGVVTVESDWGERSIQTGPRAEQTARSLLLIFFGVQKCRLRCRRHAMSLVIKRLNYEPEADS